MDKNRHFLTPSTHPVHVVVECPLTFSSHSNFFNAERLPNSIIELCCILIFKTCTYSLESISPFLFSEFEGQQKNKESLIFDRLMTIDFIVFGKGQEISEDFFFEFEINSEIQNSKIKSRETGGITYCNLMSFFRF